MVLSFLCSADLELSNSIIDILLFLFRIIWIVSVGQFCIYSPSPKDMARDAVLIRTERDFKQKELENKGREQREGMEKLCRAYAEPGATCEKQPCRRAGGESRVSSTFQAAIRRERCKLGHEKTQTSSMSLQSSGSESCSLAFDGRLGDLTPCEGPSLFNITYFPM